MSFGKPPPSIPGRKPSAAPSSTAKKPPLVRASSALCRPTAASAARNSFAKGSATSTPASSVRCKPPRNLSAGSSVDTAEAERLEAEELYSLYLQSELMRLTALDNGERTNEEESKECTLMWTAVSLQRNQVTDKEIREDELEFLRNFALQRTSENSSLDESLERLPETAAKLRRLATALERSQDFLQVSGGVDVRHGDVEALREAFRSKRAEFDALLGKLVGDRSLDLGITLTQLRKDMGETIKCYDSCHLLLTKLRENSIREESLRLSLEELKPAELDLEIPPPVPVPILVDI